MFQVLFVDLCQDTNTNVSVFILNLAIGVRKESRFSEEENIIGNFLEDVDDKEIQNRKYQQKLYKYKIENFLKGEDDEEIQNRKYHWKLYKNKIQIQKCKIQIQNRKFPKRRGQRGNTKSVARVGTGDCENVKTCWSSKKKSAMNVFCFMIISRLSLFRQLS